MVSLLWLNILLLTLEGMVTSLSFVQMSKGSASLGGLAEHKVGSGEEWSGIEFATELVKGPLPLGPETRSARRGPERRPEEPDEQTRGPVNRPDVEDELWSSPMWPKPGMKMEIIPLRSSPMWPKPGI